MTWTKSFSQVSQLYKKLGLLKLHDVYKLELVKYMHKFFKHKLPKLCNYDFTTIDKIYDYATRKLSRSNCFLPRVSKSAGQNKIEFRGAKLGKEISENLKNQPFNSFKKQFKEKFTERLLVTLLGIDQASYVVYPHAFEHVGVSL